MARREIPVGSRYYDSQPEPCRRWTATIKYHGDPAGYRTITTTVHGPNPSEAERRYCAAHPDVSAVILHSEQR